MGSNVVLWLFVINLGVTFGAGLYEQRVVVPRWAFQAPDGTAHWNAEAAREDDTGRKFWALVTTLPLTLLTLANLVVAWRSTGGARAWWIAAALCALADRLFTFSYFIPTMVGLMKATDTPAAAATATRWVTLNYVRMTFVAAAWLASLQAFALFNRER